MTKQNKRTAIWISKESREIIEKYAKDNMLGLGDAIDSILSQRAQEEERLDQAISQNDSAIKLLNQYIKENERFKERVQKPWWKFWR